MKKTFQKIFLSFLIFYLFTLVLSPVNAITQTKTINDNTIKDYIVSNFHSEITLNQNTTLTVKETIDVNFNIKKHGIYRTIPIIYAAKGKTIRAKIKNISITNAKGEPVNYQRSNNNQSVELKIGSPDITIIGPYTYNITYTITDVIQIYDQKPEIYWNVTGHEWNTTILQSSATINSPYANIIQTDCFAGIYLAKEKNCTHQNLNDSAIFATTESIGQNYDFTILAQLATENQLQFPGPIAKFTKLLLDNIGYPISLLPLLLIGYLWYQKGRDSKYLGEQIYYKPDNPQTQKVSPFTRMHLPMVYSPIQGLTPSEIGTIIDERVDIHDIVAEIIELARLKYLKITKFKTAKLFGKSTNYIFTKLPKDPTTLSKHQSFLLKKIFQTQYINSSSKKIKSIKTKHHLNLPPGESVLLSKLKNKFYVNLDKFRSILYEDMKNSAYFNSNPQKEKIKWVSIYFSILLGFAILQFVITSYTFNVLPIFITIVIGLAGFIFASSMASRTAWGYSLYNQIKGLKYFIKVGKWRQEIAEKNLFLEEMLPLAIALEIVNQLSKDMKEMDIKPPEYLNGFTSASLAHDLNHLENQTADTLSSSPSTSSSHSGRSSWSGGSGFSGGGGGGGFSGGGFGGGGGGSW